MNYNIILDPINQRGHKDFNIFFIKLLELEECNYVRYYIPNWAKKSLLFYINSISKHLICLQKSKNKKGIFLYFDNLSVFLLSYLFDLSKHSFIVHNNLEFAMKSTLHNFMYKRIAKSTNLIYLENRLEKIGLDNFQHRFTLVTHHPIIEINLERNLPEIDNVFISSRNLSDEKLIYLCNVLESDKIVYCNGNFNHLDIDNLICQYFDNLDQILINCKKIYLIGSYKFRCSGILYRVLSMTNICIVLSDKDYFIELNELSNKRNLNITIEYLEI